MTRAYLKRCAAIMTACGMALLLTLLLLGLTFASLNAAGMASFPSPAPIMWLLLMAAVWLIVVGIVTQEWLDRT